MPFDLNELVQSLQRGLGEIPPIAIALVLLAGPTVALIGYRFIAASRRLPVTPALEAAPYWVCHGCRSVNELRLSRCYRCGANRDAVDEVEVIVDRPAARPATFTAPAGSPFAALGGMVDASADAGIPVVAEDVTRSPVAVGPGPAANATEPVAGTLAQPAAAESRR